MLDSSCQDFRDFTNLNDWVDVNEVQSLNLMRLDTVGALHLWQHSNYFFSESSTKRLKLTEGSQ